MKLFPGPILALFCLLAAICPALAADSVLPAIPANIAVPDLAPMLVLTGRGVQIYECRAVTGEPGKFAWTLKAPEADLFDAQGHKVGRHYEGPTWEMTEGGKVVGKLQAKTDAPDGKGIPWLLLEVASREGRGALANTQKIQRLATVGGQPPSEAADSTKVGQERRVDYSATYVFYAPKP